MLMTNFTTLKTFSKKEMRQTNNQTFAEQIS